MDALRDLGATDVDQLFEVHSKLGQTLFRDVLSLVVHRRRGSVLVECDPGSDLEGPAIKEKPRRHRLGA